MHSIRDFSVKVNVILLLYSLLKCFDENFNPPEKKYYTIFHVMCIEFWNGKPCFIFTKIILRRLHMHKKNCGFQFLVYSNLFVSCTYFIINSISKPFVARTSKLDQMFVVLNFTEIQFLCY